MLKIIVIILISLTLASCDDSEATLFKRGARVTAQIQKESMVSNNSNNLELNSPCIVHIYISGYNDGPTFDIATRAKLLIKECE